jgi:hypothetical protein
MQRLIEGNEDFRLAIAGLFTSYEYLTAKRIEKLSDETVVYISQLHQLNLVGRALIYTFSYYRNLATI